MKYRHQLAVTTAVLALMPFAAQAAAISWTGALTNAWATAGNWTPAGPPATTSAVTIGNTTNNPVQITTPVSLNATSGTNIGSLTVGTGVGSTESVNLGTGGSLTMGTHTITLAGGSITGTGSLSSTGTIQGYGTVSAPITGTSFTANSTNGTSQVPGAALSLVNQSLTSDSFTISSTGTFNLQGDTISGTTTLSGHASNLIGNGNNNYGLYTFTGAASTLGGTVNMNDYETFNVTGTTLHLNALNWNSSWGTNAPSSFNIGVGGVVDNTTGASTINGQQPLTMSGGTLSNSGGGSFTIHGIITGTGTVSGPMNFDTTGAVAASGGLMTVDGTAVGGITVGSTGWGASAGSTLDMKGTFNYPSTGGFLNPGGGTIQLDSATLNNAGHTIYTGAGSFIINSGVNTLNTALIPNGSNSTVPNVTVKNGATLSLNNTFNSTAIWSNNFTMENGSKLVAGPTNALSVAGSFFFQQTDTKNAWTYNGDVEDAAAGLGPDLIMTNGTKAAPVTLEVGGVNEGNVASGYIQNFALDSLTLGSNAYVDLVDQNANATPSGWVSGVEALYLEDGLFGVTPNANGSNIPTLNLEGLYAYVNGRPGFLLNGLYTDANGGEVNIIGQPAAPEPATWALLGTGLIGLGLMRRRRRT